MYARVVVLLVIVGGLLVACGAGTSGGNEQALAADAGADFSVRVGEQPRFDGCGSTGDMVNYKWTIVGAPENMSEDVGKVIRESEPNCSFNLEAAMVVDELGVWEVQLEVRDGAGNTAVDGVNVTVVE